MQRVEADLVFVGVATMDTIASVQAYPEADSRTVATDLVRAGGGPAATAAVAAARLAACPALVAAVGDDVDGEAILAELRAEGVNVDAAQVVADARSGASVITVDSSRGTRAILNRPPPQIDFGAARARDLMASAVWVHADQIGLAAFGPLHWPDGAALRSYDGGNPSAGLDLSQLDLYVPTLQQLQTVLQGAGLQRAGTPAELLRAARAAGAGRVVATDGPHGAYAMDTGTEAVAHVPAAQGSARSTLGAGDVFHGALVAALSTGVDLIASVAIANTVALGSCAALDGRSAIPRLDPRTTTIDDLDLQGAISWH